MKCAQPRCNRDAATGEHLCRWHDRMYAAAVTAPTHDHLAARIDPTTDRDRWDDWNDGGLEQPGGDQW